MSTVDAETSAEIAAMITAAGGAFLEAPVSGSKVWGAEPACVMDRASRCLAAGGVFLEGPLSS